MARLNLKPVKTAFTHEGGNAWPHTTPEQQLRRSLLSCLLWENEFYEDGESIADRIVKAAESVSPDVTAALAIEARSKFNLRHAPLLLLAVLARTGKGKSLVSDAIAATIQRADELAEFVVIYAKANGVPPDKVKGKLSAQVKKGLARAFGKFDAYALGKYDRAGAVRLRDVMFLAHPKPKDAEQDALWKALAANKLESADTWEVSLSAGADKKETFERLIRENKLGYLALLRNLRNMAEAGCDTDLVRDAILARKGGAQRVFPFRYIAAARACPQLEPAIDAALSEAIAELPILPGKTAVLVDVSRSMEDRLSARSDMTRMDAAAALASIIHGDVRMFSFSDQVAEVPPRRGMAGVDAIVRSQPHHGTRLFDAVALVQKQAPHERMIVITDEQAEGNTRFGHYIQGQLSTMPKPTCRHAYVINVASAKNGVGYGPWTHIDGFSEQVLRFIVEHETARAE